MQMLQMDAEVLNIHTSRMVRMDVYAQHGDDEMLAEMLGYQIFSIFTPHSFKLKYDTIKVNFVRYRYVVYDADAIWCSNMAFCNEMYLHYTSRDRANDYYTEPYLELLYSNIWQHYMAFSLSLLSFFLQ
jgi:hypothetical protein